MLRSFLSLLMTIILLTSAWSQDMNGGLELGGVLDENGILTLTPKTTSQKELTSVDSSDQSMVKPELNPMTLNDWYIATSPSGQIIGVQGVPEGAIGAADFLKNSPKGTTVKKSDYSGLLKAISINSTIGTQMGDMVVSALNQMVSAGQNQICSWKAKPETFKLSAKINVNLGIGGEVSIDTDWKTKELCAALVIE